MFSGVKNSFSLGDISRDGQLTKINIGACKLQNNCRSSIFAEKCCKNMCVCQYICFYGQNFCMNHK